MGDFLDKTIAKRTERNPDFPRLVEEEMARLDREYPPSSDSSPRLSPNVDAHRPIISGGPMNTGLGNSAQKVAKHVRELADRRKHKTPA